MTKDKVLYLDCLECEYKSECKDLSEQKREEKRVITVKGSIVFNNGKWLMNASEYKSPISIVFNKTMEDVIKDDYEGKLILVKGFPIIEESIAKIKAVHVSMFPL